MTAADTVVRFTNTPLASNHLKKTPQPITTQTVHRHLSFTFLNMTALFTVWYHI